MILWSLFVVVLIFTFIYYVSISRAEQSSQDNQGGIQGTNLDLVLDYIKEILSKPKDAYVSDNVSSFDYLNNEEEKLQNDSELNRKLLDECLAKSENEWIKLQLHYKNVLEKCISLDLGLNGEKLFKTEDCEYQINPFKTRDKDRIQNDKNNCFNRYSERQ